MTTIGENQARRLPLGRVPARGGVVAHCVASLSLPRRACSRQGGQSGLPSSSTIRRCAFRRHRRNLGAEAPISNSATRSAEALRHPNPQSRHAANSMRKVVPFSFVALDGNCRRDRSPPTVYGEAPEPVGHLAWSCIRSKQTSLLPASGPNRFRQTDNSTRFPKTSSLNMILHCGRAINGVG